MNIIPLYQFFLLFNLVIGFLIGNFYLKNKFLKKENHKFILSEQKRIYEAEIKELKQQIFSESKLNQDLTKSIKQILNK